MKNKFKNLTVGLLSLFLAVSISTGFASVDGEKRMNALGVLIDDFKGGVFPLIPKLLDNMGDKEIQMPPETRPKSPEALKEYLEMRKKMAEAIKTVNERLKIAKFAISFNQKKMEEIEKNLDKALALSNSAVMEKHLEGAGQKKEEMTKLLKKSGAIFVGYIFPKMSNMCEFLKKTGEFLSPFQELKQASEKIKSFGERSKTIATKSKALGTKIIDYAKMAETSAKEFLAKSKDETGKPGSDQGSKPKISGAPSPGGVASSTSPAPVVTSTSSKPPGGSSKPGSTTSGADGVKISPRTKVTREEEEGPPGGETRSQTQTTPKYELPKPRTPPPSVPGSRMSWDDMESVSKRYRSWGEMNTAVGVARGEMPGTVDPWLASLSKEQLAHLDRYSHFAQASKETGVIGSVLGSPIVGIFAAGYEYLGKNKTVGNLAAWATGDDQYKVDETTSPSSWGNVRAGMEGYFAGMSGNK